MVVGRGSASVLWVSMALALLPGAAFGQALRQKYNYDALGRLTVTCNATGATGQRSAYTFDAASNRTVYNSYSTVLTLNQGQNLTSPNGKFILAMQHDGNLVVYGDLGSGFVYLGWSSNTYGSGATAMSMQSDGNIVVYTPSGNVAWDSSTWGNDCSTLAVQNDGNVVISSATGQLIWSTNTGGH